MSVLKITAGNFENYYDIMSQQLIMKETMTKAKVKTESDFNEIVIRYNACKAMAKGYANSIECDEQRVEQARIFCAEILKTYWSVQCKKHSTKMPIESISYLSGFIERDVLTVAQDTGKLIDEFPVEHAGYLIGSVYTVMLPKSIRSKLGAYYTPPPLVSRLLNQAEKAGVDFSKDKVIDPACGGGAFLAPTARRMLEKMKGGSAEWMLKRIEKNLKGIEIDPFAAWIASVLLESTVLPLCVKTKKRIKNVIDIGDTLNISKLDQFDLVIGNPPYGRVTLTPDQRSKFSRSLYGHSNLYGLFTDMALHLTKEGGKVAYLTPTSFLGGQYFKSLRKLLTEECTPASFDFISDRNGVFDDVLQETLLAVYVKEKSRKHANLSVLYPQGLNNIKASFIGKARVPKDGTPWVLPKSLDDAKFISLLSKMPTRLVDLGYRVSTGPLVWNRHKEQLRTEKESGVKPLIWAESVSLNKFKFSSKRKNHVPYIQIEKTQPHLITNKICVLLQRTTAKEQERRLISAILPQEFLDKNSGAVIENHLNVISKDNSTQITEKTLSILLNSISVDRAFRGISGSVAVSAYELNSLPLPSLNELLQLQTLIENNTSQRIIELTIASFYERKKS